jgi:RimJ/RimL family protein N-acetyltransferase
VTNLLPLRTQRLQLRRPRHEDAVAMSNYCGLPEVAKYQSWTTFGLADATQLIVDQQAIQPATPDSWLQLMIVLADANQPIGDCGIHFLSNAQHVELGITLDPNHQHGGFACEALEGVLHCVFGALNMRRASATTDAENEPARRLFQRLGFRQEAHFIESVWFKGTWGSEYLFAMLQSEWQDRLSRRGARPDA